MQDSPKERKIRVRSMPTRIDTGAPAPTPNRSQPARPANDLDPDRLRTWTAPMLIRTPDPYGTARKIRSGGSDTPQHVLDLFDVHWESSTMAPRRIQGRIPGPAGVGTDLRAVKAYVDVAVWAEVYDRAEKGGMTVSAYLRALIERDTLDPNGCPTWAPASGQQEFRIPA